MIFGIKSKKDKKIEELEKKIKYLEKKPFADYHNLDRTTGKIITLKASYTPEPMESLFVSESEINGLLVKKILQDLQSSSDGFIFYKKKDDCLNMPTLVAELNVLGVDHD